MIHVYGETSELISCTLGLSALDNGYWKRKSQYEFDDLRTTRKKRSFLTLVGNDLAYTAFSAFFYYCFAWLFAAMGREDSGWMDGLSSCILHTITEIWSLEIL